MNIQTKTDKPSELTTFTLKGDLDFKKLITFVETHHKESGHTNRCLWDFRAVTGGERVSVLQMGQFYGLCKAYFYGESAHRIAFVINEEMGFGFTQVMTMFEELYDVYLNVRTFKRFQDAMDWLGEDST